MKCLAFKMVLCKIFYCTCKNCYCRNLILFLFYFIYLKKIFFEKVQSCFSNKYCLPINVWSPGLLKYSAQEYFPATFCASVSWALCVATLQTTVYGALLMLLVCKRCVLVDVMAHRFQKGAVTSITLLCPSCSSTSFP